MNKILLLAAAAILAGALVGCSKPEEGDPTNASPISNAASNAGNAVENTADNAGNAVDNAANATSNAASNAANTVTNSTNTTPTTGGN